MFEPTADLEKDYLAYCEIQRRIERADILDSITSEKSPEDPSKVRTRLFVRHLDQRLDGVDMAPLAAAMPHCAVLPAARFTASGMTDVAYKLLIQAIWKSPCLTSVWFDFHRGLPRDPGPVSALPKPVGLSTVPPEVMVAPHEWLFPNDAGAGGSLLPPMDVEPAKGAPGKGAKPALDRKKGVRSASDEAAPEPIKIPDGLAGILVTHIQDLSLRGNDINDAQATLIANALTTHRDLLSLNLWGNHITDAGATKLAEALRVNRRLTALNLGHNLIGDPGAIALAQCFKNLLVDTLRMTEMRNQVRVHVSALPEEMPAYPLYEELGKNMDPLVRGLKDDKRRPNPDKPRTANGNGKRGAAVEPGQRAPVPWDCDVIRMGTTLYIVPGNQTLWSLNLSNNAALTNGAARCFVDLFQGAPRIEVDPLLDARPQSDWNDLEEGDRDPKKGSAGRKGAKDVKSVPRNEEDGSTRGLQDLPVSQWPLYGVGETGCPGCALERICLANDKLTASALEELEETLRTWKAEQPTARVMLEAAVN